MPKILPIIPISTLTPNDTVHEMAKDEARHGAGFAGMLKRYFGK